MIGIEDKTWRALSDPEALQPGEEAVNIRAITSIGTEEAAFPSAYWIRLSCGRQINLSAQQATYEVRKLAQLVMEAG